MRVWLPMSTLLLSKTKEYRLSLQYHRSIVLSGFVAFFVFWTRSCLQVCTGRRRAAPETRDECRVGEVAEEVGVNILQCYDFVSQVVLGALKQQQQRCLV